MKKRLLKAKEISCRINTIQQNGLSLLLYVSSRAGQNILDETYGPLGWQRHHKVIDGNLYCTISVWDEDKRQWIEKEDVGTESYTEKEKGRASDSFKRACVNFGIARELYSAPYIWIDAKQCGIKEKKSGERTRLVCNDKFYVKVITYNSLGEVDSLEIVNQNMETVYKKWPAQKIDSIKIKTIADLLEETGIDVSKIYDMCSIHDLADMDVADYQKVINRLLKAVKDKSAVSEIPQTVVEGSPFR